MGKPMWIWPFFILLIHQRVDVCRASTVSPERNHSASTVSPKRNYPGKEFSGAEYIMYAILVFASFFLFAFICINLRHRHRRYRPRILQRNIFADGVSLETLRDVEGLAEPLNACKHFRMAAGCSTSSALKKSYRGNLDSKVLSSSLGNRPFSTKVCDRLDTETKSVCRPIPKRIAMESQLSFQASSCMAEVQLKITDEANLRKNKVGLNDSNESAFLPEGSEVKEKFISFGIESSAAHDSDVKICIGKGFEVKDKFNSSGGELNAAYDSELSAAVDSDVKISIGNYFEVKNEFNSSGGELSAALDSDVKICIGNGAIPTGVSQEVFYRVVYDTTELLRNIPVGPDETLISPVIECGPHDIRLLKPLKIIIPHCLYMGKAKKEWITVYRTDPGPIRWEKIPNESKKNDMSRAWFTAKEDSIHIKTMTFCFWCVYCRRGAPRKKRATVFASKPNPRRDLIFFRFYIYSDNKDSMRRVKTQDREQFPDSWKGMEKPFKMYNNSKKITVKLMVDPEEGWELDKTAGEQVYICDDSHGGRFRYKDACTFAVKPVKGREVEEFSCNITFQQEGLDTEHAIYLNPGFSLVEKLVEPANACTHFNSAAGCSTSSAPAESDRRSSDEQPKTPRGLNKSWSVNFPRQRYTESGGLEATSHTVRGSKSASGCSKSLTQEESDRGNLNEQSKTPQDSKLLSSLLDNRSFLKNVCDRLDTKMKNYGDYRDVCSYYGFNRYEVATNFATHDAGPSTALLEFLAVKYPKLTVDEFASVLKNVTQRNDVIESLEEYDNE